MVKQLTLGNQGEVTKVGQEIYREQYQEDFEKRYFGQFVAIDVNTGLAYVSPTDVGAYESARASNPNGVFFLLRVGYASTYRKRR